MVDSIAGQAGGRSSAGETAEGAGFTGIIAGVKGVPADAEVVRRYFPVVGLIASGAGQLVSALEAVGRTDYWISR